MQSFYVILTFCSLDDKFQQVYKIIKAEKSGIPEYTFSSSDFSSGLSC